MNGIRCGIWAGDAAAPTPDAPPCFAMDTGGVPGDLSGRCIVAPLADADRIDQLIAAGAHQVLPGEAALRDATLVPGAIERHGGDRIGIWARVRRARSQWRLDSTSNADFRVVAMTNPVPRWLVLSEDRVLTDVDAVWWTGRMAAAGCASVLVSVDAPEDDDLLACAEMAEALGERFWLNAESSDVEELRFWVRYGQVRHLVLPAGADPEQSLAELDGRLAERAEV